MVGDRITLVSGGDNDDYFSTLPYTTINLPHVFKPVTFITPQNSISGSPSANIDVAASDGANVGSSNEEDYNASTSKSANTPSSSSVENPRSHARDPAAIDPLAIEAWRKAAIAGPTAAAAQRDRSRSMLSPNRLRLIPICLNIDDQRVDPPPEDEDFEVKESMLDRIEYRSFCNFHHLLGKCTNPACKFEHGERLSAKERAVLVNVARRIPCAFGSQCRNPHCTMGHLCPDEPGCRRGRQCKFFKVHGVDGTVITTFDPRKHAPGADKVF